MSRGAYIVQPSSASSLGSSAPSSPPSRAGATTPDFANIQHLFRDILRASSVTVRKAERFHGHLHQVYLVNLTDGSALVLKCLPTYNVRVLRHERSSLDTQCRVLGIVNRHIQLPVPRVIQYEAQSRQPGSSFLVMSHLPGRPLSEISPWLTSNEKNTIDRTLDAYIRTITTITATQFGTIQGVAAKKGGKSWRMVFLGFLEAALRDAEDMLVTVPYDSIRYHVERHSHFLDEVIQPRLVALDAYEPDNVLIDENTKQVSGLIGFSNAIWGDALMCEGLAGDRNSFSEGPGRCPVQTGSVEARMLMYETYRATIQVVAQHYRPHTSIDGFEARRSLACALNNLAQL